MFIKYNELTIRNADAGDAAQLTAWWNDGAVMAHAGWPKGLGTTVEAVTAELAAHTDHTKRRLMIEINGERFHCLHLFAGNIQENPTENVLRLEGHPTGCRTAETRRLLPRLAAMPEGRTLVFGPGFHVIDEYLFPVWNCHRS